MFLLSLKYGAWFILIQFCAITGIPVMQLMGGLADVQSWLRRLYGLVPESSTSSETLPKCTMWQRVTGFSEAKLVATEYEFHEQLVTPHPAFLKSGRGALLQALTKLPAAPKKNGKYRHLHLWRVHLHCRSPS